MSDPIVSTELPSLQKLRAGTTPPGAPPFRVGIVVGPGFIPMDMVGVQTVFGLMPGAEIHLLWKTLDLADLGAGEIVPPGAGVVVDDGLFTAGPGVGSFEAALLVAADAFGDVAGELAELIIEYDPHPPFSSGLASSAKAELVTKFDELISDMTASYRRDAIAAFSSRKAA